MTIDLLFAFVAIAITVIVFSSRGRREKAAIGSRTHLLLTAAPVVNGSYADGEVTGTYGGHHVQASLRRTGRIDAVAGQSTGSNIEVLALELQGVPGASPWGFFTSAVTSGGRPEQKWRSAITFAGVLGQVLSHLTAVPVDPGLDDRLRAGGMLAALERLVPRDISAPYVLVSFVPDHTAAIEKTLRRMEAAGGAVAERAREEAGRSLKLGGQLRIEIERASEDDPSRDRFRELLDAAIDVADLNAVVNR